MPNRMSKSIGIFGGTFDPIHIGHCRAALEIYQALQLDEMRLIPCKHPPHRAQPSASPEHRLNMAHLAVAGTPLQVDDREMHRDGPSYSVDTLMSLRREFPKASLCFVVGIDAFMGLTSWYQWEKLIQLTNIVVTHRKGYEFPKTGNSSNNSGIAALLEKYALNKEKLENQEHQGNPEKQDSLCNHLCGKISTQTISGLEISASSIRNLIETKRSPAFLLPEKVLEYIQKNELYGYDSGNVTNQQETIHV